MWKQLLDLIRKVVALTRDTEKNAADLAGLRAEMLELRQDFKDMNRRVEGLSEIVQRLIVELHHDREVAEKDREILLLRLDKALSQFERRLPPDAPPPSPANPLDEGS